MPPKASPVPVAQTTASHRPSQLHHPRSPAVPDPLHVVHEFLTRDLLAPIPAQWRVLVRVVEGVLQQPHVGVLHGAEHGLELRVPQPLLGRGGRRVHEAPAHVHDTHEADPRVGLEAVGGEAVVDGLQEAVLAREPTARYGVVSGTELKHVDRGGEDERELEGGADRCEVVGYRVLRWEDGNVHGVVLGIGEPGARKKTAWKVGKLTFLPMTPKQAIEGIAIVMVLAGNPI